MGKVAITLACGAIGALIGNRIGGHLDEQQKAAIAQTSYRTLNASADGQTENWQDNKVQARVVASNTQVEQRPVVIVRERAVQPSSNLALIGADYRVATNSQILRSGPSAAAAQLLKLPKGSVVHVVGRVMDTPYVLVSRSGTAVGYAELKGMTPIPLLAASQPTQSDGTAPVQIRNAVNLDNVGDDGMKAAASAQGVDLDNTGDMVAERVLANVQCRDVQTTLTEGSSSDTTNKRACKAPDGAWELL